MPTDPIAEFTVPDNLMSVHTLIVTDPEILSGRPIFFGTRVLMGDISACLRQGYSRERVQAAYPSLPAEVLALFKPGEKPTVDISRINIGTIFGAGRDGKILWACKATYLRSELNGNIIGISGSLLSHPSFVVKFERQKDGVLRAFAAEQADGPVLYNEILEVMASVNVLDGKLSAQDAIDIMQIKFDTTVKAASEPVVTVQTASPVTAPMFDTALVPDLVSPGVTSVKAMKLPDDVQHLKNMLRWWIQVGHHMVTEHDAGDTTDGTVDIDVRALLDYHGVPTLSPDDDLPDEED